MMIAAGRHLHHHQMHHRQGQATLSVLPETMEGAEIATASQLSGVSPGPPPAQSSRRPARHSSARTGPLLAHSHHRAYLREQAAQLDDRMQRKSIVSCPLALHNIAVGCTTSAVPPIASSDHLSSAIWTAVRLVGGSKSWCKRSLAAGRKGKQQPGHECFSVTTTIGFLPEACFCLPHTLLCIHVCH